MTVDTSTSGLLRFFRQTSIAIAVVSCCASISRAQSINISGTVVDSATSQPVVGATVVLIENNALVTTTSATGTFTLSGATHAAQPVESRPQRPSTTAIRNLRDIAGAGYPAHALIEAFDARGERILQVRGDNATQIRSSAQTHGLYFVRVRSGLSNHGTIGTTAEAAAPQTTSLAKYTNAAATYTIEIMKTSYASKQVSLSNGTASAGTIKLATRTSPYFWVQMTQNAQQGLARYGYCGAWDQNPVAVPGQFMFAQVNHYPYTGFPCNDVPFGILGQTSVIDSVYKQRTPIGGWKSAAYQDTKNFDLHIVSDGNIISTGPATSAYNFAYVRLRPLRDGTGKVTGFSKPADLSMTTMPGGTANAWMGSNFNLWEVVDGTGAKRLMVCIQKDRQLTPTATNTNIVIDCYLGLTTNAAGTEPDSASWVGLDNVSKDPTYIGTIKNLPNNDSYFVDCYAAQHTVSHRVELFQSQAAHGIPAEHDWVTITPVAGSGAWTAKDAFANVSVPPPGTDHYLTSYNTNAGWGCFAIPGLQDDIWWIWDDGTVTRISRVKADGTVDWSPLPTIGERLAWNSFKCFAIAPDGAIGIIDISDALNAPIRGRICRNNVWSSWINMGNLNNTYNYLTNPLQGLAKVNGEYWFGAVTLYNGNEPGRSQESTVVALSFAAVP